eukprot:Nk52_evm2s1916 gene=Nk52_evmTU2s1916
MVRQSMLFDGRGYRYCEEHERYGYCYDCLMVDKKGLRDLLRLSEQDIKRIERDVKNRRKRIYDLEHPRPRIPKKCIFNHPSGKCKCWLGIRCVEHNDPLCKQCINYTDLTQREKALSRLRSKRFYERKKQKAEESKENIAPDTEEGTAAKKRPRENNDTSDSNSCKRRRVRKEYTVEIQIPVEIPSSSTKDGIHAIVEYLRSEGFRPEMCGTSGGNGTGNTFQLWTNGIEHGHPLFEERVARRPRWTTKKDNLLGSFDNKEQLDEAYRALTLNKSFALCRKSQPYESKDGTIKYHDECSKGVHRVLKSKPKGPNYTGCKCKISYVMNEKKGVYELYHNGEPHNHPQQYESLEQLLIDDRKIKCGRLNRTIRE